MSCDTLIHDLRYTSRSLRRDGAFFAAAVLIIGVAIAANTVMFSVSNALLVRPLDFRGSDRLVWISNNGGTGLSSETTRVGNYQEWRRLNRSFEDLTAYFAFFDYGTYDLLGFGEPERLVGVGVAQNFLPFLGVQPMLGRSFSAQECQWNGPAAAILTHGLWQRRFGSDPGIVGRTITLNSRATTVVGVLPASFDFATTFTPGSRIDMLVPFPITPETDRYGNTLAVLGRLKPGVSVRQAQAEFEVINEQIRRAHPELWAFGAKMSPLQEHLTGRFRRGLWVLLAAVGAVLLIACTNLSNLLLARAVSRRKEMAVRSALGASRGRLIRQMLTESVVLAGCGAALGLALAWVAARYVGSLDRIGIPLLGTVRVDGAALLFTIGAAFLTALLGGVVPALHSSAGSEAESLGGRGLSDSRRTASIRGALVISEVALACVLLVGAGLLIRSFLHVLDVDLGFRPERAAAWRIDTAGRYNNPAQQVAFYDRLVRAVEAVPGVESAAITDALPLSRDRTWSIRARGVSYPKDEIPTAHPRLVDYRYLRTMRIPLVAGREFTEADTAGRPQVIIVNQKLARLLWPGQNAVGQRVIDGGGAEVVGVAGNVRHQALESEGGPEFYVPITQAPAGSVELVVRTRLAPEALAPSVRAALRGVDSALPTTEFQPLGALIDRAVSPRRFLMLLLGGFALAAVVLAAVGIYGVISYTVSQRRQEIGVRMALGASALEVQRYVMGRTLRLVAAGIVAGLVAGLGLARLTASLLFQMQPLDPPTFLLTASALTIVAAMAGYVPAWRASRLDPTVALRTE